MKALTDEQINNLNLKHGWFEFGDAQSAKTKAFVRDVEALCAEKAEAELDKLTKGIMNVYDELGFEMDQDGYDSIDALSMVEEIAENSESYEKLARKAEADRAELRDAVAWHFECREVERYRVSRCMRFKTKTENLDMYLGKIPMTDFVKQMRRICKDSILELRESLKHAEQQLREIGSKNAKTKPKTD